MIPFIDLPLSILDCDRVNIGITHEECFIEPQLCLLVRDHARRS